MINSWLKQGLLFIVLILLQVLVLNHISFFNYATPFLYVYFIIKMPLAINRNILMLISFLLGLIIDIFCNTPGQNAAAAVFAAFLRRPVQLMFFEKEDFEHIIPNLSSLGASFMKYASLVVLIHHTVIISISSFSYINFSTIVLRIIFSSILTSILIFAVEGITVKKRVRE
ncbi:MAG TPA: rod shape-determining protein MreD [Dysgonomonas sp.]|nr:rod shape-determining protein MreD [Dysgonomonas sp.]